MRVVSAVKSRPNYYEMLGLAPSAAGDAIARAFARATSVVSPQAFGTTAEICLAYQTLRDPARRRAYDASIGLVPERSRPVSLRPASAHFATRPAMASVPAFAAPRSEIRPPEPQTRPEPAPEAGRPIQLGNEWQRRPLVDDPAAGFGPIEWKRTGTFLAALVAVAVFIGAMAGLWSGSSAAEPEQSAKTAAVPDQREAPNFSDLSAEPASHKAAARPASPDRAVAPSPPRIDRAPRPRQFAASENEAQLIQPPQDIAEPEAGDPLAPETDLAPAVASSMPLPHRTVARTIDRIGYRCGSVASATAVDGDAGVYTVTCTSGQSFQARPVKGRYRFRRL